MGVWKPLFGFLRRAQGLQYTVGTHRIVQIYELSLLGVSYWRVAHSPAIEAQQPRLTLRRMQEGSCYGRSTGSRQANKGSTDIVEDAPGAAGGR